MTPQTKSKTDWRSRPEMQKLLAVAELSERIFWAADTMQKAEALIAKWRHKGLGPNPLAMAADWEARSQIFGWGPHPKKNNDKHDATQQGERVTQPVAVGFAKAAQQAEEEYRDYQRASADNIARAAKIIGAKTKGKILTGNLGCHHCTVRISGARIELTVSNLDADRLAKIAAVLDAEGDISR